MTSELPSCVAQPPCGAALGSEFEQPVPGAVLPVAPYKFLGSWSARPQGNSNIRGLSFMNNTTEVSKLKPAGMPAQITHTGSVAIAAVPPKATAVRSAIQAFTLTLSERVLFHPPPHTISEIALMPLPNRDIDRESVFAELDWFEEASCGDSRPRPVARQFRNQGFTPEAGQTPSAAERGLGFALQIGKRQSHSVLPQVVLREFCAGCDWKCRSSWRQASLPAVEPGSPARRKKLQPR